MDTSRIATPEEMGKARVLVLALCDELNALMDERVGPGNWPAEGPNAAESACITAEADIGGWLYAASTGEHLRNSYADAVANTRRKLTLWAKPMPKALEGAL